MAYPDRTKFLNSSRESQHLSLPYQPACEHEPLIWNFPSIGNWLACISSYWHRSLNPKKLIEVKFSHLGRNMTMQRTLKLYRLPEQPQLPGFRKYTPGDLKAALPLVNEVWLLMHWKIFIQITLINNDSDFSCLVFIQVFTGTSIYWGRILSLVHSKGRHCGVFCKWGKIQRLPWLFMSTMMNRGELETIFYISQTDGQVTDFISFYSLPSTIMHHPTYKTLRAAYSFYMAATKVTRTQLVKDALIIAKQVCYNCYYSNVYWKYYVE